MMLRRSVRLVATHRALVTVPCSPLTRASEFLQPPASLRGAPTSSTSAPVSANRRPRIIVALALALAACRPTPTPPAPPPAPVPPVVEAPSVVIRLTPVAEGVRAVFELSEPRDALTFAAREAVTRHAWTVETPGVTLDETGISAAEPVSRFTLLLRFDAEPRDRVFPSVTRVGGGAAVFVPALLVQDVDVELRPGGDLEVWPPLEAPYGYSYLGVAGDVERRGRGALIGFGAIDPWLGETIAADVDAALDYYAKVLGQPATNPTVVVSETALKLEGFHGDVTDNAVIFLRFGADSRQRPREETAAFVATFVRHESFHLWDSGSAPGTPPWLHEGAAEYAALVSAVTAGSITEDDARRQVSGRVRRCHDQSRERGFSDVRGGQLVYDCGVTLQWLADLHLRRASSGTSTVFSVWSELLPRAAAGDPYTVEDFRERAGPLVSALLDGDPSTRWSSLETALHDYGVTVSDAPADDDYRAAMLRHLVTVACGEGPVGFWREPDHIRLDTTERCGRLAGQPRVTRVSGHDVLKAPKRAFDGVTRACRASRAVRIETLDGATISLPCATELPEPRVLTLPRMPGLHSPK
jgi:hypothetical protein